MNVVRVSWELTSGCKCWPVPTSRLNFIASLLSVRCSREPVNGAEGIVDVFDPLLRLF